MTAAVPSAGVDDSEQAPRRRGRPGYDLESVLRAAVEVFNERGYDGASMEDLSRRLGIAKSGIYHHVSGKEELLTLMVDAAWGPVSDGPASDGPAPGEGWRAGLSRWTWALRAGARRHPWVVRIPLNGLPIMPNEVAWFENALACMAGTGLSEARKASVIMLLAGYVRTLATTEADIGAAIRASGLAPSQWMAAYPRMLAELADPARFPALARFIAAGVFEAEDGPDDEFSFGLDRILDGVAVLIEAG